MLYWKNSMLIKRADNHFFKKQTLKKSLALQREHQAFEVL